MRTNLARKMERSGVSVEELAKEAFVSTDAIKSYRCGRRLPSIEVAYYICQYLGCSIDDIFTYPPDTYRGVSRMSLVMHEKRISVTNLAELLDVSRATISRYKNDPDVGLNPLMVNAIAWALDSDPDYIFGPDLMV